MIKLNSQQKICVNILYADSGRKIDAPKWEEVAPGHFAKELTLKGVD